jgi:small subunit ribosomal protein S20
MPNIQSAKKEMRSSSRRRLFNDRRRRAMRTVIKQIRQMLKSGDVAGAQGQVPAAYKAIDKAAKRGVIKPNAASRTKSRLVAAIKKAA